MSKRNLFTNKRSDIGLPPGTLPDSTDNGHNVPVNYIRYNQDLFHKERFNQLKHFESELESIKTSKDGLIHWIDISNLKNLNIVKTVGDILHIHPLIIEDIAHTHQRPKFEDLDNHIYLAARMIYLNKSHEIVHEQVSFILGPHYLISFQEFDGEEVFNIIRKRLEANKGRVRKMGSDYLMYSLLDAIVDNYFVVLDSINEELIQVEDQIEAENNMQYVQALQNLKQEIFLIRRYTLPLKEMLVAMMKDESCLIKNETIIFLKDLQDHTVQIMDTIDMLRDISLSILETSRSALNYKMNEIIKLLTVVSTIFIPITFIVGVYGMNFKHMPELDYAWAYPAVWLLMIFIVVVMLIYFKKKKWL